MTGRTVATGLGFVEGPTLRRSGTLAVVSLDHQRVYSIAADGSPVVIAETDAAPNGATEGADGTLYLTAFSGAWPARPECHGIGGIFAWRRGERVQPVSLAPAAPNDLCFGPDGRLYVTDPVRGGSSGSLWRIDVESGEAEVLAEVAWYPNGIAFDGDDTLWVADMTGRRLVRYRVAAGRLSEPVDAVALRRGRPDGFAFDVSGHVVVAAPGTPEQPASSVQVFDADGTLVEVLLDGGSTHHTNVAISAAGAAYVTEAQHGRVLALDGRCAPGLPLHPFR
ncbi:MAG: SMP-30/gluconolactonase/LRE family protein [Nitriliruptorales bacterium]|nr:SMP-30/gluconolactonase/LRE family protein [Nitriliruptorales bacterium]